MCLGYNTFEEKGVKKVMKKMKFAFLLSIMILPFTITACSSFEKPGEAAEQPQQKTENELVGEGSTEEDVTYVDPEEEKKESTTTKENPIIPSAFDDVDVNFMNKKITMSEKNTDTMVVINRFTKYLISYKITKGNEYILLYSLSDGNYLSTNCVDGTDGFFFIPYYGKSAEDMVADSRIPIEELEKTLNDCGSKILYEVIEGKTEKEDRYIFIDQAGWTIKESNDEKKWFNSDGGGKLQDSDLAGNPIFTESQSSYSVYTTHGTTNITRIVYSNGSDVVTVLVEDADPLAAPPADTTITQLSQNDFEIKLDMALSIFQYDNPSKKGS